MTLTLAPDAVRSSTGDTAVVPPASDASPSAPATFAVARPPAFDIVEEWGLDSFPASDPPSNW